MSLRIKNILFQYQVSHYLTTWCYIEYVISFVVALFMFSKVPIGKVYHTYWSPLSVHSMCHFCQFDVQYCFCCYILVGPICYNATFQVQKQVEQMLTSFEADVITKLELLGVGNEKDLTPGDNASSPARNHTVERWCHWSRKYQRVPYDWVSLNKRWPFVQLGVGDFGYITFIKFIPFNT